MEYRVERFEGRIGIPAYLEGYVDVEGFLACCRECPNYGQLWSCPPYDFDPMDVWRAYGSLLIVGRRVTYTGDRTETEMEAVLGRVKQEITDELESLRAVRSGSMPLSAGSCAICEGCTRPAGAPCRHPGQMRYSIESLGGNVGKTIRDVCGVDIEWIEEGRLPEHFVLVGGLLEKEREE
ncbi:MAG: DUF2284 domain-containing protein [Clostridiales bacterium]|nr:DUF2284 domain-containing protein [Clostridiales bacterium]